MTTAGLAIAAIMALIGYRPSEAVDMPIGKEFTNSIGMKFVCLEPGIFSMGGLQKPLPAELTRKRHLRNGDPDEQLAHKVTISKAFYIGVYEVTNAQYEKFDPTQRCLTTTVKRGPTFAWSAMTGLIQQWKRWMDASLHWALAAPSPEAICLSARLPMV